MSLTDVNLFRIDGNIGFTSNLQTSALNGGPLAGTRNRIINGDMRIDQRNAGAAVTVNNSAAFYATDRWFGFGMTTAGVFTLNRSTSSPTGFTNSLAATCTTADASIAAGDRYFVNQAIEGFNAADLGFGAAGAQAVALSFWVQSSLTGTYCATLINSAGDRSYVAEYSIAVANTWEYKTIYIPGDTTGTWLSDNNIGVGVRFTLATGTTYQTTANAWAAGNFNATSNQVNWMSSSSSRTFRITGVQLEPGTVATPFERRSYGQELALCQRYFEKSHNIDVVPGTNVGLSGSIEDFTIANQSGPARVRCAVSKRRNPTVNVYDATGNVGFITTFTPSQNNFQTATAVDNHGMSGFKVFMSQANLVRVAFHWTADAEL